jgi:polysaccharide biosynthesis transport protein
MTSDDTIRDANGHTGRLRWSRSAWQPRQLSLNQHQETRLARLTAGQLRRAPGAPASWSRFLLAHARWILAVTLAAVGVAAALTLSQTPVYQSQAVAVVEPPPAAASSGQPPDMATEEGVVTSGAVLARASRVLHVPMEALASGLSVSVPGTTTLLQIRYSDASPRIARVRAQAIAQAYVSYRASRPARAHGTNSANPAAVSTAPSATLITPASLPSSPASPNYLIDIGVALIVGLALAIGSAGLRDHLDDRLRGPLDLEAQAGAPVLALLPAFRRRRRDPGGRLVMVASPGSLVAEAYRGLRTRLVQAAMSRNAKALLVTSAGWEDKSTVSANLATTLAQSGRSVVLVCADLRWSRADELFGVGNGEGLSGLLEGRTSLSGALQATKVPGLRLLPPGAIPADPAALLQSPAWHTALSDIRMQADVVVVEAPPVLASPDARPLADTAEMILFVADARRSTRAQVRVALREVDYVRDKLVGCVLDNVGRRRRLRSGRSEPAADGRAPVESEPGPHLAPADRNSHVQQLEKLISAENS